MDDTARPVTPAPRLVRVLLAALIAAGLVATFGGAVRAAIQCPKERIPLPPVDAAPAEVVTAYVAALDACDDTTARALSTPDHAKQTDRAEDGWFRNVVSIRNLTVEEPIAEPRPGAHSSVYVPVFFDLDIGRETSMTDGHTRWGYVLVRESATARWLVAGEGIG